MTSKTGTARIPTIYLTRTGLLEPLGQSQVLAYLKGLSSNYETTLISFERSSDLSDTIQVEKLEAICAQSGIRWIRLNFLNKPRILGAIWNLLQLLFHAHREVRRCRARVIHARSYIPAAAASIVSRLNRVPFIFDMRSLWPEELITSRRLQRGSLLHKLIFLGERHLLAHAAVVISLTHAGRRFLVKTHPRAMAQKNVHVIPTCADLDRFKPISHGDRDVLIGCHGSLMNGWFRVDLLARMFDRIAARVPNAKFEIITRENPDIVLDQIASTLGRVPEWFLRLAVYAVKSSDIHLHIQRQSLSVFFYASGAASELGRSPTRMGEALGCGVPVLTNEGIGDVAEIVRSADVGHVMSWDDEASFDSAIDAVLALLADSDVSRRCRQAAEEIYSLESGVVRYRDIYQKLTGG